jgi:hypothetical protein
VNLTFSPFGAVGLAAVTLAGSGGDLPAYGRVVDIEIGHAVRRLALDPELDLAVDGAGTSRREAARLDALVALAERGDDQSGWHDCGGA